MLRIKLRARWKGLNLYVLICAHFSIQSNLVRMDIEAQGPFVYHNLVLLAFP